MTGTWGAPNLPSGLDQFTAKQQPHVVPCDDLSGFVMDRIREAETEPRIDQVPKHYHEIHGATAHRYAAGMRRDMVAFRRVVAEYCTSDYQGQIGLVRAVMAIAMRWSEHPDFKTEWRLE